MRLFFLLLFSGLFLSQTGVSQAFENLLAVQKNADPREVIHLHLDKNYYNPGETIWFKAYLLAGDRIANSKNFYAELLDEKGKLIDKKTAPIILSGAASHFDIPATFKQSTLFIRAYTINTLQSDSNFLYAKAIRIIQLAQKLATKPYQPPQISFLPEGGSLINGLEGRVAFKATTANSQPVFVKGLIQTTDGQKITEFQAIHNGMGTFTLRPEVGKKYQAVFKDEKNKEYTTALPEPEKEGIVLQVNKTEANYAFSLQRSPDASEDLHQLTVVGYINQELVYQARINFSAKTQVAAKIPIQDLPSGILTISVLDKNNIPRAERICFVNNSNFEFDADAWISEVNTGKRALNRGEVKIGDTLITNLSVAITDADMDVPPIYEENIITRMLLSGHLRGKIHQPYYYFYSTSDSAALHLDLVMMTHGWRKYNWANVLEAKTAPKILKEGDYLGLNGQLVGLKGAAFKEGLALNGFLRAADSGATFVNLPINREGEVLSDGFIFYDSAKLYLSFNDKNKDFDASMFNVNNGLLQGTYTEGVQQAIQQFAYEPDSLVMKKNSLNALNEQKVAAKRFKDAHELQNVTVIGKTKTEVEKMDERYASGMFSGGDAKMFDVANDPMAASSFSIFQYLQGRVAGLQINMGSPPTMTWRGGSPVVYIDEMQSDADRASSISMADVAFIKIFNPGAAGAIMGGGNGIISVYTKRGSDATSNVDSRLALIRLNGYSGIKQFFAPDYSSPSQEEYYDNLRTTLYWEPFVVLNKTEKRFRFKFYNSDISKRFRIVLEGINAEGKLIHVEKQVGGE